MERVSDQPSRTMPPEPLVYRPARLLTEPVAPRLPAFLTPDVITVGWGVCLLAAAALILEGSRTAQVAAAAMIVASYVLDCLDGDVARVRDSGSKLGAQLEQFVHWIGEGVLIVAATAVCARQTSGDEAWLIGIAALAGGYTFAFVYGQLHLLADRTLDYGFLHVLTRWLYRWMPLSTNVLAIGALTDQVLAALAVWGGLSLATSLIVFALYYRVERGVRSRASLSAAPAAEPTTTQEVPDGPLQPV